MNIWLYSKDNLKEQLERERSLNASLLARKPEPPDFMRDYRKRMDENAEMDAMAFKVTQTKQNQDALVLRMQLGVESAKNNHKRIESLKDHLIATSGISVLAALASSDPFADLPFHFQEKKI